MLSNKPKLSLDELKNQVCEELPDRDELMYMDYGGYKAWEGVNTFAANYPSHGNYDCGNQGNYQGHNYNVHYDNGNHYGQYKHDFDKYDNEDDYKPKMTYANTSYPVHNGYSGYSWHRGW